MQISWNVLLHVPFTQEIFYEENQKEYNSKKAAKKRRKQIVAKKMKQAISTLNLQEHDDVSRETFASDTEEGPSESALGTEDNSVVYNTNDLEVFWCSTLTTCMLCFSLRSSFSTKTAWKDFDFNSQDERRHLICHKLVSDRRCLMFWFCPNVHK